VGQAGARFLRLREVARCCAHGGDGRGDTGADRLIRLPNDPDDDAANGALYTDLSMDDSAFIIKDLDRQGITYELKNDGTIILAPA
jgi:hypothetical protein